MGDKGKYGGISRPLDTSLGDDDVLLGRGKRSYNHEGNCRFRKLVLERAKSYKSNENRAFRKAMAQEVINIVERNGGKFLRPVESESNNGDLVSSWERVPVSIARTKVKQALRDMGSGLTPHRSQEASNKTAFNMSGVPLQPSLLSPNPLLRDELRGSLPASSLSQFPAIPFRQMHLPLVQTGLAQPNPDYARVLQMALLQQRIQENEQRALMLQALEQERTAQITRLIQQHRPADLPGGLIQQEQELLRGLNTSPNQTETARNSLLDGPVSLSSTLMQSLEAIRGLHAGVTSTAPPPATTFNGYGVSPFNMANLMPTVRPTLPAVASGPDVLSFQGDSNSQDNKTTPSLAFARLPVGPNSGESFLSNAPEHVAGSSPDADDTTVSTQGMAKAPEDDSEDDQSEP